MPFVRTVLGDIDPVDLGVTYAHEHLVIDGGRPVQLFPDFRLDSVEDAVAELAPARALGLRAVVDAMPADCGRNVAKLAEISRRSGVHVVAPTGLHHERYYHDRHWSAVLATDAIADLFVADVTEGIDANDYAGPVVRRTPHRAGVIKVAGDTDRLTDVEERVFAAAAAAHVRTGVPILTHCEGGTAGPLQARFLIERGVRPANVVLRTPTRWSTAPTSARSSPAAPPSSTTRASAGPPAARTGRSPCSSGRSRMGSGTGSYWGWTPRAAATG